MTRSTWLVAAALGAGALAALCRALSHLYPRIVAAPDQAILAAGSLVVFLTGIVWLVAWSVWNVWR